MARVDWAPGIAAIHSQVRKRPPVIERGRLNFTPEKTDVPDRRAA
jgi:hypothetical protein